MSIYVYIDVTIYLFIYIFCCTKLNIKEMLGTLFFILLVASGTSPAFLSLI